MPLHRAFRLTLYMIVPLILWLATGTANAREPSSLVLEITEDPSPPPLPCRHLQLHDRALYISPQIEQNFSGTLPSGIHRSPDLPYLEETRAILFMRTDASCHLWFLSDPSISSRADGIQQMTAIIPGFRRIEMNETEARLITTVTQTLVKNKRICLKKTASTEPSCRLWAHYYGRLPLVVGSPPVPHRRVEPDDAVTLSLAGPGDRAMLMVPIYQAGMVVVEYKSQYGPGAIDIRITDENDKLRGTGGASFPAPGTARIEIISRSVGPDRVDLGVLFNPDLPLFCSYTLNPVAEDKTRIIVSLVNAGTKTIDAVHLDAGTVWVFQEEKVLSGAHPGRPSRTIPMQPGQRQQYTLELPLPLHPGNVRVVVDGGSNQQKWVCRPSSPG